MKLWTARPSPPNGTRAGDRWGKRFPTLPNILSNNVPDTLSHYHRHPDHDLL